MSNYKRLDLFDCQTGIRHNFVVPEISTSSEFKKSLYSFEMVDLQYRNLSDPFL